MSDAGFGDKFSQWGEIIMGRRIVWQWHPQNMMAETLATLVTLSMC